MSPTSMVPCSESHFTSAGFNVASSGNMAQILQFDKVLSQAPIGIALMDEEGVYEDVNAAYSHLYGYRQDELIGQSVTRIFLPAEHARVLALHRSFLEEGKALPGTWQAVRQDGTRMSTAVGFLANLVSATFRPPFAAESADYFELPLS